MSVTDASGRALIERVQFKKDHRVFKRGDSIDFRAGVNLLVGDQGVGKSTLLTLLRRPQACTETIGVKIAGAQIVTRSFDFERDNLRTAPGAQADHGRMMASLAAGWSSHGQFVNGVLAILTQERDTCFLMDEPDMALSVRSVRRLAAHMQESARLGNQMICACHNPELIAAMPEVYSLEHRRWMTSAEFLDTQRNDLAPTHREMPALPEKSASAATRATSRL